MVVHVASRGLPHSRHYNLTARRLKTLCAPARLREYELLIEMLCAELNAPIYLFEQSMAEVADICYSFKPADMGPGLRKLLETDKFDSAKYMHAWNPAILIHWECGVKIDSMWQEPLQDPSPEAIAARVETMIKSLQKEKRQQPGRIPVRIIFTEADFDLYTAIYLHNFEATYLYGSDARIELYRITETW